MRIDVLSCPAPLGPLQGQSLVPQASLIPPVLFPGHLGAVAVPQCQCPVAPGPSSPRLSLKSCREEEWAGACAVPSWCQCTTRVPTNTLLLVPAGAQTEPAQPFHYGAIADWSSGCISCSSFIPSKDERCWQQRCTGWRLCPRAWMAHAWKRKNFQGRWWLRARSRLPTRAGRGRRVQELSKSFTPAQLQQHRLFQLHTLHPVPRFSLG